MARLNDPISWLEYSLRNLASQAKAWKPVPGTDQPVNLLEKLAAIMTAGQEKFGTSFPSTSRVLDMLSRAVEGNSSKLGIVRSVKEFVTGKAAGAASTAKKIRTVGGVAAGAGEETTALALRAAGNIVESPGVPVEPPRVAINDKWVKGGSLALAAFLLSDLLKQGAAGYREGQAMDIQGELATRMARIQTPESIFHQAMIPALAEKTTTTHQAVLAKLLGGGSQLAPGEVLIGGR